MADIEIPAPEGRKDEKQVGIIIAVIAVLMAIVGSLGNNAADDMIVGEVKSSNGYAWYQAKRQREYLNDLELRRIEIDLLDSPSPIRKAALEKLASQLQAKNLEYRPENEEIRATAEQDAAAAKISGERNDAFGHAEILLQASVVLCSLTLLTSHRGFLYTGLVVALVGILLAGRAWFLKPTQTAPPAAATASSAPAVSTPAR
jgi:hypothetical protein